MNLGSLTPVDSLLKGKMKLYYSLMSLLHSILRILFSWRIRKMDSSSLHKILLANWGSLGDLVLSTGVIAAIKTAYPQCKIGLITSEYSKEVCATSPSIDWIHITRPWLKPGLSKWKKPALILRFAFLDQPKLVKEIAKIEYDCAIELRPFFPNLIPVFWKAKIPIRIGFATSGNDKLLTASSPWRSDQYLPFHYKPLLEQIGIHLKESNLMMQKIVLKNPPPLLPQKPYLLFHLCSSDPIKELPLQFWKTLYGLCKEKKFQIYFTGKGKREQQLIEQVTANPEENLCNKLSWTQLVQHIQACRGLVSIDSVPIHLAAGLNIPTLALFVNTEFPHVWAPPVSTTQSIGISSPCRVEEAFEIIRNWI